MTAYNIKLVATDGTALNVGKIVPYKDRLVFHAWAQPEWLRQDINAYGISKDVIEHADTLGITDYYLYLFAQDTTYHATREQFHRLATVSDAGTKGTTVNLPLQHWEKQRGRIAVPFVNESVYQIVEVTGARQLALFGGEGER